MQKVGRVSRNDERILFLLSGCRCAKCREPITIQRSDGTWLHISEIAHIGGVKPKALRHDPNMTEEERNAESNLIVLCSNCHNEIDNNEQDYTVKEILRIKKEHEQWVLSWSAGETNPERLTEMVTMDLEPSILKPTRPNTSGVCEDNGEVREAFLWQWLEGHYDEKHLKRTVERIQEYFGDKCCINSFEFGPYVLRPKSNLRPIFFGFTSKEMNSITQMSRQSQPEKEGSVFQLSLPLREYEKLPWLLRGLMKRLLVGRLNEFESSDMIRKGWLVVPSLRKLGLQFRLVPTNPDLLLPIEIKERKVIIEELISPDGRLVLSIRISSPIGSHNFLWQVIGSARVESDGYDDGQLLIDAGWDGGDTVLRFWIPKLQDPDDCVHDCSKCPLLEERCFEPHYLQNLTLDDMYTSSEYVTVYLSESERCIINRLIRKAAVDIHKKIVSDSEEEQLRNLIEKAQNMHDTALDHLKDIESYLRSKPLTASQKKKAIEPIGVIKHWIGNGGKFFLPPEVYRHQGSLTEEDMDEISNILGLE